MTIRQAKERKEKDAEQTVVSLQQNTSSKNHNFYSVTTSLITLSFIFAKYLNHIKSSLNHMNLIYLTYANML